MAAAAETFGADRIGWQVLRGPLVAADFERGKLDRRNSRFVALGKDLDLRFEAGEPYLGHLQPAEAPWRALYPYAVTEGPSTFVRLLKFIAEQFDLVGRVELTMGLWTTGGWGLAPGAPNSYGWEFSTPGRSWPPAATDPFKVDMSTTWGEIRARPGLVAHHLIAEFYATFGWDEEAIPFWDQDDDEFRF